MLVTEQDELLDVADAWAEAIVADDAERIGAFMTEDWVIVSEDGITTRGDFLALVSSGALSHSAMQRVGEPHVRIAGDTAILTARITNTAHFGGQRFDADEWTTDVFERLGGRWLCAHSHITAISASTDGA